jgi:hypothetical protein
MDRRIGMISRHSVEQISQALFKTDPMRTCCKENDCFDEYDRVASDVLDRLVAGERLEQALSTEISEWFFGGEQFDQSRLQLVLELLGKGEQ